MLSIAASALMEEIAQLTMACEYGEMSGLYLLMVPCISHPNFSGLFVVDVLWGMKIYLLFKDFFQMNI